MEFDPAEDTAQDGVSDAARSSQKDQGDLRVRRIAVLETRPRGSAHLGTVTG